MPGFAEMNSPGLICELFIKSSIVLAAAILCCGLLRRRSAALRHFVLSISLVGLVLLPALSVFSPGWRASWLPAWASMKLEQLPGTGAAAADHLPAEPGMAGGTLSLLVEGAGGPDPGDRPGGFPAALSVALAALWLAGMVLVLARLAAGLWGARRITREGEALDDPVWRRLLRRFVSAVRLRRTVEIKAHPQVPVPVTWGFRRPVVIMPAATGGWSEDARSAALFHELSHVKRGDFLVMLFVRLSLAVFWFNPLFWVAYKMIKDEQEKACDELVLKAGIRPSTYAENLLSIVRSVRLMRSPLAAFPGVLGMFGRSRLRERLLVILGRRTAFKEVGMKTKVIISVSVFLAVAFIGLARPQVTAAAPESEPAMTAAAAAESVPAARATSAQESRKTAEKQNMDEAKPAESAEKPKKIRKDVKIVVEGEDPGTGPVEITVIDGQTRKGVKLDGSALIVKKGADGKTVLVSPEGKEIAVIGGEGARLEIKGGRTIFLEDEKAPHAHEGPKVFTVIEDAVEPEHITIKHLDEGDEEIIIKKRHVTAEPPVAVWIEHEELQKKLAETQALLKKIEEKRVAGADLAAQGESLKELEHSLQALEEELKKNEEGLDKIKVVVEPKIHITHERGEPATLEDEEIAAEKEAHRTVFITTRDKAAYAIMLDMNLKGDPKQAYGKAVARLEKELPQGFKLEPKLDEKAGMMTIKITAPGGSEEDLKKVQRIVEELRAELGK